MKQKKGKRLLSFLLTLAMVIGLMPGAEREGYSFLGWYGEDGEPAKFLKAVPKTDGDLCDRCGICVSSCPMGSIDASDCRHVTGVCIKCQACVLKCPRQAKYFDDPDFLSHVRMLEKNFREGKEAEYFLF